MSSNVWATIDAYADYWRPCALACLALAAVSAVAFGGVFVTAPSTTTTTATTQHPVTLDVSTYSIVTSDSNPLYAKDAVVRNASLYSLSTMPEATVTARTIAPSGETLNVTQSVTLVVTGHMSGQPFWTHRRTLSTSTMTVTSNTSRTVTTSTTLSMPTIRDRITDAQRVYGGRGAITATLVVETQYAGAHTGALRRRLPIQVGPKTYRIGAGNATHSRTYTHTVTRQQSRPMQHAKPFGFGALGFLGVALVAGFAHRVADPSRTEWDYQLAAHDEWISEGTVHTVGATACIEEASIADLVNVAIDSDARVIHDPDEAVCLVVVEAGEVVHYCTKGDRGWSPPTAA